MEATKRVELEEPVQWGAETVTYVTVRKPKGKDLRRFPTNSAEMSGMIDFMGMLIGQTPGFMDELSMVDMLKLFEVVQDFLPDSLKTGSKA